MGMNTRISIDKITVVLGLSISPYSFRFNDLSFDFKLRRHGSDFEVFKYKHIMSEKPFSYEHHFELWNARSPKMIVNLFRRDLSGKMMPYCEFTFNPNKHYDDFPKVLAALGEFGFTKIREITRVDIAVDFPLSPYDIELLCTRPIQVYQGGVNQYTRYKRYADRTMLRVYNKAMEEGIKGDKTRCELVLKNWIANRQSNFETIWRHFGDIYYRDIAMDGVEYALHLPRYIAYAIRNIPSCRLRDFIPMLSSKYKDEAQRYFESRYKGYVFTLDDYDYICKLLRLYLPMLKESEV